jgi:2-C-methyl-D-erythritol 2,4-cyclodiphosphate synthase
MYRVGFGFDAHKFAEGGKVILGGVEIPFELGLSGHSDADVLSHAICDALLGTIGAGDIGSHFPDSDPEYKGVSSLVFVKEALEIVRAEGYEVGNIDSVIICEKPKISPHVSDIKENLSRAMGIDDKAVSVKATTTDKMGFTGREEGIAAYAVVLVDVR